MNIRYFKDGSRLIVVCEEMTAEEEADVVRQVEEKGSLKYPDAQVKPIEVYKSHILNGKYRNMTAEEALESGGDDAFLWLSKHVRNRGISGDGIKAVNAALNEYVMTRFELVDDPEEYVKEKPESECTDIINTFRYAIPGKVLGTFGYRDVQDVLNAEAPVKRRFTASLIRSFKNIAKRYH